jgi:hypothetical protein
MEIYNMEIYNDEEQQSWWRIIVPDNMKNEDWTINQEEYNKFRKQFNDNL